MSGIVAEQELIARLPDGQALTVHIRVGCPYLRPTGEWACPVEADGLPGWHGARDVFGEDSLQALTLGLRLLRAVLLDATRRGANFSWPDSTDALDIGVLFWPDQGAPP